MRKRARDEDFIRVATVPRLVLGQSLQKLNLPGVIQIMSSNTRNETEIAGCTASRSPVKLIQRYPGNGVAHGSVGLFQHMDIALPVRFTDFFRAAEPVGTRQRKRTTTFSCQTPADDIFPVSH